MLQEPLSIAPAFLQHPVQVATQLPHRGDGRFGFPLPAGEALIVGPDGAGGELERLHDLDQDPLEPAVAGGADASVVVRPPELCVLGTSPA